MLRSSDEVNGNNLHLRTPISKIYFSLVQTLHSIKHNSSWESFVHLATKTKSSNQTKSEDLELVAQKSAVILLAAIEGGRKFKHFKNVCIHSPNVFSDSIYSQSWHSKFNDSALDAVVSDVYKYFYKFGPRWQSYNPSKQWSLAIFKKQQHVIQSQRRKKIAKLQVAAMEYHGKYMVQPFQLPHVTVSSLAHEFARGDYTVTIVTTACLPWLTGTSINPLLRAMYLESCFNFRVTILFPWIPMEEQLKVYNGTVFVTREEQAEYVIAWVKKRLGIEKTNLRVLFYDAWYDPRKGSIFPLDRSDVTENILDGEADVAVLEEPEHLCWYHLVGPKWRTKFRWVVGIAHTNYVEYIKRDLVHGGPNIAKFVFVYNWLVASANCHRVIRLSAAVQPFADSLVCNVHGVSPQFLNDDPVLEKGSFSRGFYFIGKVLWGKGYRELCDLLLFHCQKHGFPTVGREEEGGIFVDVYGSGFDEEEIMGFAAKNSLPLKFFGKKDHADVELRQYKVFVNPSVSDVLCTTTAEALAMGKLVVIADHPSNEFFRDNFPENCIAYDHSNPDAFSKAILLAQAQQPAKLKPEQKRLLTWEAATERFLEASDML